jgi:hypothetical protein
MFKDFPKRSECEYCDIIWYRVTAYKNTVVIKTVKMENSFDLNNLVSRGLKTNYD